MSSVRRTGWRGLLISSLSVGAVLAFAWWLSGIWSPTPPRSLTMATGPAGGAYTLLAERYRPVLAHAGIQLRLRATAGSVENVGLLRNAGSGVGVAFLQAGITSADDAPELVSLGTVFYEPLWLFRRGDGSGAASPAIKRLATGPEGSGTRVLTSRLLTLVGIGEGDAELLSLTLEEAADALVAGKIGFAAVVDSWEAPVVKRLITTPGIELMSFPRADAHVARNPYLNKLVLPAGVADLARNVPPVDVVLVAPKASLVVRRDLHPALQYLLLDAASEIHSRPGLFTRAGEFPAAEANDLPLAEGASQFYKKGRPFLHRHLPFWLASITERLLILLVPLLGVIIPLFRWVPGVYVWNVRRRIFRMYSDLKLVQLEAEALPPGADTSPLVARLEALEERIGRLKVPAFHASIAYTLLHHVRLVRERLERRIGRH